MTAGLHMTIAGIQEAQARHLRMIAALRPGGALSRVIYLATVEAHRYAVLITHVDTGALRASHRISFDANRMRGEISIDPATVNPRGERPAEYGPEEHARGGSHAFYRRTAVERGPQILRDVLQQLRAGLL